MEINVATYLFSRSVQNTLVEDESTTVTCVVSLVRKIYEIIYPPKKVRNRIICSLQLWGSAYFQRANLVGKEGSANSIHWAEFWYHSLVCPRLFPAQPGVAAGDSRLSKHDCVKSTGGLRPMSHAEIRRAETGWGWQANTNSGTKTMHSTISGKQYTPWN